MVERRYLALSVDTTDIVEVLKSHNIPVTKENIEAATTHVESVASAWAGAVLQDTQREEWMEWIETFKEFSNER